MAPVSYTHLDVYKRQILKYLDDAPLNSEISGLYRLSLKGNYLDNTVIEIPFTNRSLFHGILNRNRLFLPITRDAFFA